jgi:hypothetical protein
MAARTELRAKSRRQFHYNASVLLDGTSSPHPCAIADISDTGARLVLAKECELPERASSCCSPAAAKQGAFAGWFGAMD